VAFYGPEGSRGSDNLELTHILCLPHIFMRQKNRRRSADSKRHVMRYRILDSKRGNPKREFTVHASPDELRHLVERGFLVRPKLIPTSGIEQLRTALCDILIAEDRRGRDRTDGCFGSPYLRHLLDKHGAFLRLFKLRQTLSIARAVLGPQVRFDEITARVTDLSNHSPSTPWHIHLRVVPDPVPPFFAYPHAIECLLYLDDVDEESGPLCVLPGSHRRLNQTYSLDDITNKPDQEILPLNAGDCLVMHPNLWHRALPSTRKSGLRRLVIFGYYPSWVGGDERGSPRPSTDVLAGLRRHRDGLVRELAGEFYWG
jgi:Phytanoyl-CoA dioxygenase (PhyH)